MESWKLGRLGRDQGGQLGNVRRHDPLGGIAAHQGHVPQVVERSDVVVILQALTEALQKRSLFRTSDFSAQFTEDLLELQLTLFRLHGHCLTIDLGQERIRIAIPNLEGCDNTTRHLENVCLDAVRHDVIGNIVQGVVVIHCLELAIEPSIDQLLDLIKQRGRRMVSKGEDPSHVDSDFCVQDVLHPDGCASAMRRGLIRIPGCLGLQPVGLNLLIDAFIRRQDHARPDVPDRHPEPVRPETPDNVAEELPVECRSATHTNRYGVPPSADITEDQQQGAPV